MFAPAPDKAENASARDQGLADAPQCPLLGNASMKSSYRIHLVTPLSHDIAKPLTDGLNNPVICCENEITSLIPQELMRVRPSIRAAPFKIAEHLLKTNWSMAGPIPGDPD